MEEAEKVRKTAEESVGSAWREQEKWAESLQGHIGSLSASWQEFANASISTDFLKGVIKITQGILELGTVIGGLIPTLLVIGAIVAGFKLEALQITLLKLFKLIPQTVVHIQNATLATTALGTSVAVTTATISLGFVGAFIILYKIYDNFAKANERLIQSLEKTSQEYEQHQRNIKQYTSEIEKAKNRLEELNKLKEQGILTQKQAEELQNLQLQNDELERKLDLEKTLAEIKNREQHQQALQVLNAKTEKVIEIKPTTTGSKTPTTQVQQVTTKDKIDILLKNYNTLNDKIRKAEDELLKTTDITLSKKIENNVNVLKKKQEETLTQLATTMSFMSENVSKLNDSAEKTTFTNFLTNANNQLKVLGKTADETQEKLSNLGNIKSQYGSVDDIKEEQENLQKYFDEYDKNGILSVETVNTMLSKYPQYIDFLVKTADGYQLNTTALERLNSIKETQKQITDRYVESLQRENEAISSRDFAKENNNALFELQDQYKSVTDKPRTNLPEGVISDSFIGEMHSLYEQANKDQQEHIEGFNNLIDKITETNSKFADGKTTISEYFEEISNSINSIDLNKLTDSDFGNNLISNLSKNIQQGIQFANSEFSKGKINANEYINAIEKASDSTLQLHTAQNKLTQDDNGFWRNSEGNIDDFAQSLVNAQSELSSFGDYLALLNDNADYLRENLDALGNVAFDTADVSTQAYQSFANNLDSIMDDLAVNNKTVFDDVINYITEQTNYTQEQLKEANGLFNASVLQSAEVTNATVGGLTSRLSQGISKTINALGEMIGSFKATIGIKVANIKLGNLPKAIMTGDSSYLPSGEIEISGKDFSFDQSKVNAASQEIESLFKLTTGDLIGGGSKGSSSPAPHSSGKSKGKGGGGGKGGNREQAPVELKEIKQTDEYTKAIEKLDRQLEILNNDKDLLVSGSKEYTKTLDHEISLIKEKDDLTTKEIEKTKKELEQYKDLDKKKKDLEKQISGAKSNEEKNKVNKLIDAYNKEFDAKENKEKKLQSLEKTKLDLEKKTLSIRQQQYDIVNQNSEKEKSEYKDQITLLQSKQKFFVEGSEEYKRYNDEIVNQHNNIEQAIKRQYIATKALLSLNTLSGKQREDLTKQLRLLETEYQNTRYEKFQQAKEQRIKDIEKSVESAVKALEPLENRLELLSMKFDLTSTDDYKNRIDLLGESFVLTKQHISSLESSFDRLNSIQPQTKEEAEKIASEMKNVADKIKNAKKSLWEYHKAIDMAKVDELVNNYKQNFNELNGLITQFRHNMDMLSGGLLDGTDISFNYDILPDIPQSAYDRERTELESLFALEEEYDRKIRDIKDKSYAEQMAEFKDLNEEIQKESQNHFKELIDGLIKALGKEEFVQDSKHKDIFKVIVDSLTNTEAAYTETWDSIVTKVTQAISQIEDATRKGLYAYANFSKDGQFLGITQGKSGKSNHLSNADYIIAPNNKRYDIKKSNKKKIPKYASGTKKQKDSEQGHPGGYALVGEDGEELAILPSGKSIMVGKYGAELVNLPKGTVVVPNDETKELKGFLGNEFDVKTIPAYRRGTSKGILERIANKIVDKVSDTFSRGGSSRLVNTRDGGSETRNSRSSSNQFHYSKYKNFNEAGKAIDDELYRKYKIPKSNFGTNPNGSVYSRNGNGFAYVDQYGASHVVSNYKDALMFSRDGKIYEYTGSYNGGYAKDSNNNRIALLGLPGSIMYDNNVKLDPYGNVLARDVEDYNTYKEFHLNRRNWTSKETDEGKRRTSNRANPNRQIIEPPTTFGGYDNASAYGRYSQDGSKSYYNSTSKSEHEKRIDKVNYDVFLSKQMANEFNQYKANRDSVMSFIKSEQEAIKAHFAQGGLRDTISQRIDSLKDKIDEQTAKDVEIQFKMTEDILKQQKDLSEKYMNETRKKYLDGINSGMSTDALRKLKDEYADAQRQFNDIEKSIKDNIRARYDFEFNLIDKKLEKYNETQDKINDKIKLLNSTTDSKDFDKQKEFNDNLVSSYKEQLSTLVKEYDKLVQQQGKFGVGSYEWSLFEEKIKSVNKQISSVNQNIVSTIESNKKLSNKRLDYVFDTQNKALEKQLLNNKTHSELTKELNKQKEYQDKYIEGLEKEQALDLIKRDLRKEEISDFDIILSQMQNQSKITRDEYETLRKQIEVKKLEKALDKAFGNLTERSYIKNKDGTWDWQYQEDKDLVNDLQDKLTNAKIDLIKWQKSLEIKQKEGKLKDTNEFLNDLKELQKRALNGEFKNKDEFNEELKKLGLSQKDSSIWDNIQKNNLFDSNGQFGSIIQLMSTSFENYHKEIIGLNTKLEELLKLLKIETNIRLNEWQNGVQIYGFKAVNTNATDDYQGNKSSLEFKNINDLKVIQAILDMNKNIVPNIDNVKNNIPYNNSNFLTLTDVNKKPTMSEVNNYFEKLVLPNVTDAKSFIDELKRLPVQAKQFVFGNK